METYLRKICHDRWRCDIVYLTSLNLVRFVIQIYLYQQGFLSVSADEFARGIRAAQWAQTLDINILADVQGIWLPFEKYLNGLALLIWPDEILAPRATVFIASCLLVIVLFYLVRYLFASRTAAFASTLLIVLQPWFVWMSGTPMLEMYYFALFFAGLLLLIIWLKEQRRGYWFWAGICFFLSSGFHVQSWTLINLVNLLTLPILFKFLKKKEYVNVGRLVGFYFLSNGLIIAFSLIEYANTGQVFAFLDKHTSYSKWYYGGYNVPALQKFLYYPRLVVHNANITVWAGLLVGLAFGVRDKERRWGIFPLLLALSGLLLNSVMNIFSGPPSAAPDRYALFHLIIYLLYGGYGFASLLTLKLEVLPRVGQHAFRLVALLLFVYGAWWGLVRIPDYPKGMLPDTVAAGRAANRLLEENPGAYMIELHYWDFLGVELGAAHFDDLVYDRVRDIRNKELPSMFWQDTAVVCRALAELPNLRYVLLLDEGLKMRVAAEFSYLEVVQSEGRWTIYHMIPDKSPALAGCN